MRRFLALLALAVAFLACGVQAQIQPSQPFTPGHTVRVLNPAGTTVGDAGGAAGSTNPGTGYLTEIGITNTGTPFCINDALTNAVGGYHQFCLGANALGGGLLAYNAYGGASALPFHFVINGVSYDFPSSGGNVVGPSTSTIGDAAVFNSSAGRLLADAGAPPLLSVADTTALQALPTTILALTNKVQVGTYSISKGIFSPPVDYYLTAATCTLDGGSCFAAQGGKFWHIAPQTIWDPRWWGAYGDVQEITGVAAFQANSCAVTVNGATFTNATDNGKLITLTNGHATIVNGPSYQGSIVSVASDGGSTITVSTPCPTFAGNAAAFTGSISTNTLTASSVTGIIEVNQVINGAGVTQVRITAQLTGTIGGAGTYTIAGSPQTVSNVAMTASSATHTYWGHDDTLPQAGLSAGPINEAMAFVSQVPTGRIVSGQPQLNGGGLSYGVATAPVKIVGNILLSSTNVVALSSANIPVATDGVLEIVGSFASYLHVVADSGFLPVNACYSNSNGAIFGLDIRCKNWLGSSVPFTFLGSTIDAAFFTGTIQSATCAGSGPFICTMNVTQINSQGLTGGTATAGSGFAAQDRILLSQTGGSPSSQLISVVVGTVNGSGGVTGYQIQEGGAFTSLPTAFTQVSTTHSDGTTGAGTGFAISSGLTFAPNTIQPGLGVAGTGIANGTNIIGFGALGSVVGGAAAGVGGTGTYLVENLTTSPAFSGSESLDEISLDIRVPACSPQLFTDPATSTNPGVGLVSHGNTPLLYDRTWLVACPNSRTIVVNKAPEQEFLLHGLTFDEDANGFLLGPLAGIQVTGLTASADDYITNINDHFGASVFTDSAGGTSFSSSSIAYGAANTVIGPDGANNNFRYIAEVGVSIGSNEWNSPALLALDGAQNTIIDDFEFGGQVQFFAVTGGITSAPLGRFFVSNSQVAISKNSIFNEFSAIEFAPNNTYWFYTELPNAGTAQVSKTAAYKNENPLGSPYEITFTTGGGASQAWAALNPTQIAITSQQMNVTSALYNQPYTFSVNGISTNTGPAFFEYPYMGDTANYQFTEQDTNKDLDLTGSGSPVLVIPISIAQNSVLSASPSTWHTTLYNRLASGSAAVQATSPVHAGTITAGTLYTNGTYTAVPLTGGSGTGAQGTFVISGGGVQSVTITAGGQGYRTTDTLGVSAASVGGTGSGFAYNVTLAGVTLYSGGSMVTSVTMTNLFWYDLRCIRNTTGSDPFCYIAKSN